MQVELVRDIMQVCRNGHVITNRLRSQPERGLHRCHQCGAATLSRCPTCAAEFPGAAAIVDLEPIGALVAPHVCPDCGATLPWARREPTAVPTLVLLEPILRRLPRLARQLRSRHGDRPAWHIDDEHDLEDLLRGVLHLHFDDVRLESRTPSYAVDTRMDFLVGPDKVAVTGKLVTSARREAQLAAQLWEDVAYYERRSAVSQLVALLYDPGQILREQWRLTDAGAQARVALVCIVTA